MRFVKRLTKTKSKFPLQVTMTSAQINPLQMHVRADFVPQSVVLCFSSVTQELNNRLAAEITKMRSMTSEDGGDAGGVIQGKELYELEVCFFPLCLALFPRHPGNEKLIVTLAFTGNAEGEGVRSAVSEAGDQLFKRRAPDCPKSKCCNLCLKS